MYLSYSHTVINITERNNRYECDSSSQYVQTEYPSPSRYTLFHWSTTTYLITYDINGQSLSFGHLYWSQEQRRASRRFDGWKQPHSHQQIENSLILINSLHAFPVRGRHWAPLTLLSQVRTSRRYAALRFTPSWNAATTCLFCCNWHLQNRPPLIRKGPAETTKGRCTTL